MADRYEDVLAEVQKCVAEVVRKGSATSETEALSVIFKQDRELYARYRVASGQGAGYVPRPEDRGRLPVAKQAETAPPPTFDEVLLGAKAHEVMGDLADHLGALQGTLMRLLQSEGTDKPALARQALADFTAAVQGRMDAWLKPEAHVDKSAGRLQRLTKVRDLLQRVVLAA